MRGLYPHFHIYGPIWSHFSVWHKWEKTVHLEEHRVRQLCLLSFSFLLSQYTDISGWVSKVVQWARFYKCRLKLGKWRFCFMGFSCTVFWKWKSAELCAYSLQTKPEHYFCYTSACVVHAQPNLSSCYHPPGDEGGESELLGEDLPLEPSVAKAERSHLIVWQVLYGSEWAHRKQVETGKLSLLHGLVSLCPLISCSLCERSFTTYCVSIFPGNSALQDLSHRNSTGAAGSPHQHSGQVQYVMNKSKKVSSLQTGEL